MQLSSAGIFVRRFWRRASLCTILCGGAVGAEASAEPRRWTVHLGATVSNLADKAKIEIAGTRDPDASVSTHVSTEPTIDVIWHSNETIALALSGGLPPITTVKGKGTLEPLGELLRSRAGVTTASVQFRQPVGPVHSYVGVGAAYLHVFRTEGIAVHEPLATNDLGPMIQVGMEVLFLPQAGVFAEVKKAWLSTRLTGSVGGMQTESQIQLNPLTVTAGLSVGF